jgi:DNA-binding MarR family transcriptional regulator
VVVVRRIMENNDLKNELISVLYKVYDAEVFAPVIEFLQGETRVLLYLYMNKDMEMIPSGLSRALYVTRQRIASILTSLRKKSYITMEIDINDRRKMKVSLTGSGEEYISGKVNSADRQVDMFIEKIGRNNVAELIRITGLTMKQ